jgi:hypothetical protein
MKMDEELLTGDEEETVQVRDRISVARRSPVPPDLARQLSYLRAFADEGDRERLLDAIQALVPSYHRTPGQPVVPAPSPPRPGLLATVQAPSPTPATGRRTGPETASPSPVAGASPHSTAA